MIRFTLFISTKEGETKTALFGKDAYKMVQVLSSLGEIESCGRSEDSEEEYTWYKGTLNSLSLTKLKKFFDEDKYSIDISITT